MSVWIYEYLFYPLAISNAMFLSFVPVLAIPSFRESGSFLCALEITLPIKKKKKKKNFLTFWHHKMLQIHIV